MKKHAGSLALCACLAVGCTSYAVTHPAPPPIAIDASPPPDRAHVCVVRASIVGALLTIPVFDNDKLVGATEGPSWFCYVTEPGEHLLTVEVSDAEPLAFAARPGERIYVELSIGIVQDELALVELGRARTIASSHDYALVEDDR